MDVEGKGGILKTAVFAKASSEMVLDFQGLCPQSNCRAGCSKILLLRGFLPNHPGTHIVGSWVLSDPEGPSSQCLQ